MYSACPRPIPISIFFLALHKRDECADLTQSRTCKEDLWQAQWGNTVSRGARPNDPSSPEAETDLTATAFGQLLPIPILHLDERTASFTVRGRERKRKTPSKSLFIPPLRKV